jgi:excisionase family DNA binding protein
MKPRHAAAKEKLASSEIMTLHQVADYLLYSPSAIYQLLRKGQIPAFRLGDGGDWRVRRSDIDEWISDREARSEDADAHEYKPKGRRPKPKR